MTDLQLAVQALDGHTLALCRDGRVIVRSERGIQPMILLLRSGEDLNGYSAADLIVGKAAAMLFVKAGIISVYAATLSWEGSDIWNATPSPCNTGN